jgi:hypothetical protein
MHRLAVGQSLDKAACKTKFELQIKSTFTRLIDYEACLWGMEFLSTLMSGEVTHPTVLSWKIKVIDR